MVGKKISKNSSLNGLNLGFEEKLWEVANRLRGNMDPSEYKHVVLGLMFLRFISDEKAIKTSRVKIPHNAKWTFIKEAIARDDFVKVLDGALESLENENSDLMGVLPRYQSMGVTVDILRDLVKIFNEINGNGNFNDVLGRVYEYFIGKFASSEGGGGGEYFTPPSVVRLLVSMIEPYGGKIYDPCCGTGGMFVQSEKFIEEHGGKKEDISIYGQELNLTTWRLCKMNMFIRGLKADLGIKNADTFHKDLHPNLKANYILANPPFNVSDWGGEKLEKDRRWIYGVPPSSNANFAWVQHMLSHLSDEGIAGFVLSNGSLSSNQSRADGVIRKELINADVVDCIVTLPGQLFYNTQISASLWFIAKDKSDHGLRNRKGETLFLYANDMGEMTDRTHKELTNKELNLIAKTYHSWRNKDGNYSDIPGLCKSAQIDEIREHNWALVSGRYVGFSSENRLYMDSKLLGKELGDIEKSIGELTEEANKVVKLLKQTIYG